MRNKKNTHHSDPHTTTTRHSSDQLHLVLITMHYINKTAEDLIRINEYDIDRV